MSLRLLYNANVLGVDVKARADVIDVSESFDQNNPGTVFTIKQAAPSSLKPDTIAPVNDPVTLKVDFATVKAMQDWAQANVGSATVTIDAERAMAMVFPDAPVMLGWGRQQNPQTLKESICRHFPDDKHDRINDTALLRSGAAFEVDLSIK